MKQKLPKLTKLANTLLIVSVLLQFGYLMYRLYQNTQLTDSHDILTNSIEILGLEMYLLVGSVAVPVFFVDLFSSQARGKAAGVTPRFLFILALMVYEHWNMIQHIISGQAWTQPIILELSFGLVLPVIMMLSILISSRPLAIISAIGAIALTIYNLNVLGTLNHVMGQESVAVILLSETLYGLGLFLGLIGIKKTKKITA